MKTNVHCVLVKDSTNGTRSVSVRMPNGDLKRKFLMSLLESRNVLSGKFVLTLLEEVLKELNEVYAENRKLQANLDFALEYAEMCGDKFDDFGDDLVDLVDEILELRDEVTWLEHDLEKYEGEQYSDEEFEDGMGVPGFDSSRRHSVH